MDDVNHSLLTLLLGRHPHPPRQDSRFLLLEWRRRTSAVRPFHLESSCGIIHRYPERQVIGLGAISAILTLSRQGNTSRFKISRSRCLTSYRSTSRRWAKRTIMASAQSISSRDCSRGSRWPTQIGTPFFSRGSRLWFRWWLRGIARTTKKRRKITRRTTQAWKPTR